MGIRQLTVEVIYLERGQYKSRKSFIYNVSQAGDVYSVTVAKLEKEGTAALVCLRDGVTDTLLRSERVGPIWVGEAVAAAGSKKRKY